MVVSKINEIVDMQGQIEYLKSSLTASVPEIDFATKNTAMQKVIAIAREAAASSANILLKGESGTGKTILAKAIHDWSLRAGKPFLSVSCPSLSA
jgi:NtrC-family two-component system response regulator AlgB